MWVSTEYQLVPTDRSPPIPQPLLKPPLGRMKLRGLSAVPQRAYKKVLVPQRAYKKALVPQKVLQRTVVRLRAAMAPPRAWPLKSYSIGYRRLRPAVSLQQ